MSDGTKNLGGRPSKYKPEYCDAVIAWLKEGKTIASFAASIGVARMTAFTWTKDYPEFGEAVEVAKTASQAWWEDRLIDLADNGKGNAAAIIFGLKNRGAEDWREKVEVSGNVGFTPKPLSEDDDKL